MSIGGYISSVFRSKPKLQLSEDATNGVEEDVDAQFYNSCCTDIVNSLKSNGINFFAVDFDLTLVDEHTGGVYVGTAEDLIPKIRPIFRTLLPLLFDSNIQVAVVTFSPQVDLIAELLRLQYEQHHPDIIIRGCDGSWDIQGLGRKDGKLKHLKSAIEEINSKSSVMVSLASTVLVDDDPNNIRVARANAVKAVRCFPDSPNRLISDLIKLRDSPTTPSMVVG